jgi:hypothetical protein
MSGQLCKKSRGVAVESTKSRDRKVNEANFGAIPQPLRKLLELGLMSTA